MRDSHRVSSWSLFLNWIVGLKPRTERRAGAMQQDSQVIDGNAEHPSSFLIGNFIDLSQQECRRLSFGERRQRGSKISEKLGLLGLCGRPHIGASDDFLVVDGLGSRSIADASANQVNRSGRRDAAPQCRRPSDVVRRSVASRQFEERLLKAIGRISSVVSKDAHNQPPDRRSLVAQHDLQLMIRLFWHRIPGLPYWSPEPAENYRGITSLAIRPLQALTTWCWRETPALVKVRNAR
ncbi:MAG: hypothetical protein NT069_36020 [Planctomycetota bacterium]|nr:hypothetical protein [Planctomycetota bacterium]